MGVFSGKFKCSNATETALKIKWAVVNILNPKLKTPLKVGIGIDFGKVMITKVGKGRDENNNDLVWIGQSCNYASHLSGYGANSTIITEKTYKRINKDSKLSDKGEDMWTRTDLTLKNEKKIVVYVSKFGWVIN